MLGRVLFALVWLIIAAGLALPLYPTHVETPSPAVADSELRAADAMASRCQECPVADEGDVNCQPDCPCGHVLSAAFVSLDGSFGLSVVLIIRPLPSGPPSEALSLLPELPAI